MGKWNRLAVVGLVLVGTYVGEIPAEPRARAQTSARARRTVPETDPGVQAAQYVEEPLAESCAGLPCAGPVCAVSDPCYPDIACCDLWVDVDFVLWWGKGGRTPPLVSTGPLNNGASVLFGNEDLGKGTRESGRISFGAWLDSFPGWGVMGRFFAAGEQTDEFNSAGRANVARPFLDLTPGSPAFGEENALVINSPGGNTGSVRVVGNSTVVGADAILARRIFAGGGSHVALLFGYQTTRIDDDLRINHTIEGNGVTVNGEDFFDVRNEFHGGSLGVWSRRNYGCWSLDALLKVGLGNMEERVTITGSETRQPPVTTTNGSLLALPTNIGEHVQDEFTVAPELNLAFIYRLGRRSNLSVGYTIHYWDEVARAGEQIDRGINATQTSGGTLDGAARPEFELMVSDFWLQGVTFGFETWF